MSDMGTLLLRLLGGGLMMTHGWAKLQNYSNIVTQFADPYGLGIEASLVLVIFAELVCAALLVLGLFTRLALIPLLITMATAFFIIHGSDPLQKKELALMFMGVYVVLFLTGPGKHSAQEFFKISAGRFTWLLK